MLQQDNYYSFNQTVATSSHSSALRIGANSRSQRKTDFDFRLI
jgi:hypothetical protein